MIHLKPVPIEEYDTYYIDNLGNFYSSDQGHLSYVITYVNKHNGYGYINLISKLTKKPKTFRAHILVAKAFIQNPKPGIYDQINHKDGNKLNNNIDNLEWCNLSENIKHAYKHKLWVPIKFQKHSKPVNILDSNKIEIYHHVTTREAARLLNCSVSSITRTIREYNGYFQSRNVYIEPCNDYPLAQANKNEQQE